MAASKSNFPTLFFTLSLSLSFFVSYPKCNFHHSPQVTFKFSLNICSPALSVCLRLLDCKAWNVRATQCWAALAGVIQHCLRPLKLCCYFKCISQAYFTRFLTLSFTFLKRFACRCGGKGMGSGETVQGIAVNTSVESKSNLSSSCDWQLRRHSDAWSAIYHKHTHTHTHEYRK